ncbi:arabinose efflux permease family protein [Candidatus Methanoperedens nitroreducens]|uniref:Arabinose efflux permease family protein n=1 Tax=Candidatus Methanoperedens nitratireducens TaxID=1392998 RepID=A0A062V2S0_9EURY|nr:MFS transporter [Candidatus Methanoperedens nitroreducens]KCZ71667.1 arabinose efflux permease family protein [Candidatus Methanoperedens nitroreducens]MDJ1421295.1 MFS transporter [Candidatus Methanoperedens sp.]
MTKKTGYREIYLLGILTFILMFSVTLIYPVQKEFVMERFNIVSLKETSLFVSVNLSAYVIFSLVWGSISDRMGKRKFFILAGFLGNAVLMFSLTLAPTMAVLLVLRFIEGTFTVMAFSLLMASVLDIVKQTHYGRGMGILGMGMASGNALGAPFGGKIGAIDPLYPLYFGSFMLLIGASIAAIALKEHKLESRSASLRDALLLLKEEKRIFIPYAFSFVERFTVGFFVVIFPLMLAIKYGIGSGSIGMYMTAFLIPFAFLQYPLGAISDRIGRVPPLIIGSLLYGIMVMSVGIVAPPMLVAVMVLGGVVGALMYPPSAALAGDLANLAKRGTAMGGFNLFGSLGFAAGPFIGGVVADRYGFQASFAVAGLAVIIIALIFFSSLIEINKKVSFHDKLLKNNR